MSMSSMPHSNRESIPPLLPSTSMHLYIARRGMRCQVGNVGCLAASRATPIGGWITTSGSAAAPSHATGLNSILVHELFVKSRVLAVHVEQLTVRPALDDAAGVDHQD